MPHLRAPLSRASTLAPLLLAALLSIVSLGAVAGPAAEIKAARGLSFDRQISATEGRSLGTRAVLLRGAVERYSAARGGLAYKGVTVYIPCEEHLTLAAVSELGQAPARGLLVALCDDNTHNEQLLSRVFATSTVNFPVYFLEGEGRGGGQAAVEKVLADADAARTSYVVLSVGKSLRLSPPYHNETIPGHAVTSQLLVRSRDSKGALAALKKSSPRVLLTANVDTMGVAPSTHTTGGATGAVAALELFRRRALSAAARDGAAASPVAYGLTLLLGTGARLNYATSAQWLQDRKDAEMDRYRLILCLDELLTGEAAGEAAAPTMYMHMEDTFMRREDGEELAALAQRVAAASGVTLKVQPAPTNYQHYDLRFEHEVFANRQLPAVTFSAHRTNPADQVFRGERHDMSAAAVTVFAKRIRFLEAFLSALLGDDSAAAPGEEAETAAPTAPVWVGSESYLAGMLQSAAATIRSPVAYGGRPLGEYVESLARHLRQVDTLARAAAGDGATSVTATTTVQAVTLRPTSVRLWGPYEEDVRLYIAKSTAAELVVLSGVAALLLFLGLGEFNVHGLKRVMWGS